MLKVLVFDGGCGGKVVARYLAAELNMLEVSEIIDWNNAPYEEKTLTEVCYYADRALRGYIGKVDLIVLGGYTASQALPYLQQRHPRQKFVGVGVNYYRILKTRIYPRNVTVIMNNSLIDTEFCEELRDRLPLSTLSVPDCSGWEAMANSDLLSTPVMRADLGPYFQLAAEPVRLPNPSNRSLLEDIMMKKYLETEFEHTVPEKSFPLIQSDLVLLLNTNFWDLRGELEALFGYQVRVLDFRQKLLRDVCAALDLLGVDGRRSK